MEGFTTFLPEIRAGVTPSTLIGLAVVFAFLLGYAVWTDLFRGRTIRDLASLGLVFAAAACLPLVFEDPVRHLAWAVSIAFFVSAAWMAGAFADGDLKIYLAYCLLLGPLALPVILLSWILIISYSLPTIVRNARSKEKLPRGQRLGSAPGAPGIALALPLGLWLAGVPGMWCLAWTAGLAAWVLLSGAVAWLDRKVLESANDLPAESGKGS